MKNVAQLSGKFAALQDDLLNAQTMEEKMEIYLSLYPEGEQKERVRKKMEEIIKNSNQKTDK